MEMNRDNPPIARATELLMEQMERVGIIADYLFDASGERPSCDTDELVKVSAVMTALHKEIRAGSMVAAAPLSPQDFFSGMDDAFNNVANAMAEWADKANKGGVNSFNCAPMLQGAEATLDLLSIPCSVRYDAERGEYTSVSVAGITRNL